jgi:Ykl077w/Psg1 (Pma1 Stabilization in Golgi)
VTVESTYYVTWNTDFYPANATIAVELKYNTSTGSSVYKSDKIKNSDGYVPIKMQNAWLENKLSNNLTLYIIGNDPAPERGASYRRGPTIELVRHPIEHYKPPSSTSPDKLGLIIGLPVSACLVTIVVVVLYFRIRKHRKIELGDVMEPGTRQSRPRGDVSKDDAYGLDMYRDPLDNHSEIKDDRQPHTETDPTRGFTFSRGVSRLKIWRGL